MLTEDDLNSVARKRLLETDNVVYVPIKTHIRILVSASDVLHS